MKRLWIVSMLTYFAFIAMVAVSRPDRCDAVRKAAAGNVRIDSATGIKDIEGTATVEAPPRTACAAAGTAGDSQRHRLQRWNH